MPPKEVFAEDLNLRAALSTASRRPSSTFTPSPGVRSSTQSTMSPVVTAGARRMSIAQTVASAEKRLSPHRRLEFGGMEKGGAAAAADEVAGPLESSGALEASPAAPAAIAAGGGGGASLFPVIKRATPIIGRPVQLVQPTASSGPTPSASSSASPSRRTPAERLMQQSEEHKLLHSLTPPRHSTQVGACGLSQTLPPSPAASTTRPLLPHQGSVPVVATAIVRPAPVEDQISDSDDDATTLGQLASLAAVAAPSLPSHAPLNLAAPKAAEPFIVPTASLLTRPPPRKPQTSLYGGARAMSALPGVGAPVPSAIPGAVAAAVAPSSIGAAAAAHAAAERFYSTAATTSPLPRSKVQHAVVDYDRPLDAIVAAPPLPPFSNIGSYFQPTRIDDDANDELEVLGVDAPSDAVEVDNADAAWENFASAPPPPYRAPLFTGFRNIGNSCFAGSVLTMLLRSEIFATALQQAKVRVIKDNVFQFFRVRFARAHVEVSTSLAEAISLSPALNRLTEGTTQQQLRDYFTLMGILTNLYEDTSAPGGDVDPGRLMKRFPPFDDYQQHDAHEFLLALMDALETGAATFERARLRVQAELRAGRRRQRLERQLARAVSPGRYHGSDEEDSAESSEGSEGDGEQFADDDAPFDATIGPAPETWVSRLFNGTLCTRTRCPNVTCGHHTDRNETFGVLCVPMLHEPTQRTDGGTVSDAAETRSADVDVDDDDAATTSKNVTGGSNAAAARAGPKQPVVPQKLLNAFLRAEAVVEDYKCDACGLKGPHKQTQHLLHVPPLLVLQFKRYVWRETMVRIPAPRAAPAPPIRVKQPPGSLLQPTLISMFAQAAAFAPPPPSSSLAASLVAPPPAMAPVPAAAAPTPKPSYRKEYKVIKETGTVRIAEDDGVVQLHYSATLPAPATAVAAADSSMAGSTARRRTARYRLRSIVSHVGPNPNAGHYIASVYAPPPAESASESGRADDGERAASSQQEEQGADDDTDARVNVANRRRPRDNDHDGWKCERREAAYAWVEANDSKVRAQTYKDARRRVEVDSYLLLYEQQ